MSSTHIISLTVEGMVYTWGQGRKGQLGHGDLGNAVLKLSFNTRKRENSNVDSVLLYLPKYMFLINMVFNMKMTVLKGK